MQEDIQLNLPAWRFNEIMSISIDILLNMPNVIDNFNYLDLVKAYGIKIKPYSAFKSENLEAMRNINNTSFWKEGMFVSFRNEENDSMCRMIAYNDSYDEKTSRIIILHEFGHYILKHTQQSIIGELEASCFATTLITTLCALNFFQSKVLKNALGEKKAFFLYAKEAFCKKQMEEKKNENR